MYYGYYPYAGWPSPWGPPMGMGYPMTGAFNYPYGGMSQMPYYPPPGGYGTPGLQGCHHMVNLITHHREDMERQKCRPLVNLITHLRED